MFSNADLWCLANMISYIFFSYEPHNIKRNSKRTKSMTRYVRVSFGLVQIRRFTENGQLENGETLPVFFFSIFSCPALVSLWCGHLRL